MVGNSFSYKQKVFLAANSNLCLFSVAVFNDDATAHDGARRVWNGALVAVYWAVAPGEHAAAARQPKAGAGADVFYCGDQHTSAPLLHRGGCFADSQGFVKSIAVTQSVQWLWHSCVEENILFVQRWFACSHFSIRIYRINFYTTTFLLAWK